MICSLSRDPLAYVRLTINITLDYGISARGEIGTPWILHSEIYPKFSSNYKAHMCLNVYSVKMLAHAMLAMQTELQDWNKFHFEG